MNKVSPAIYYLDWDKLKTFYYVAELGEIKQGAEARGLTLTQTYRHIKDIELYFGHTIVTRRAKDNILTAHGRRLFTYTRAFYEAIDRHEKQSRAIKIRA